MPHDPLDRDHADRDQPHRVPLDGDALRRGLLAPAGPLARLDVVGSSPSTNSELVAAVRAEPSGWPAPGALVAEHQVAGRGRAGRAWQTPPRAALTLSVLLRPRVPAAALGWLPLVAGVAVARVVRSAGVPALLKWPNDVLVPADDDMAGFGAYRKVAGVLAEVVPGVPGRTTEADGFEVVVGIGLNVDQTAAELPVPTATSLALAGAVAPDRGVLLAGILRELVGAVRAVEDAGGDAVAAGLADEYADLSATLGSRVRAELAGGVEVLAGRAVRVADDGSLVVATSEGERAVTAGDVHHLRAADSQPPYSPR